MALCATLRAAASCWLMVLAAEFLERADRSKGGGANQHEAEEIALPNILLESESEVMSRVLEELENMDDV
jgi:hypothetical protein